MEKFFLDIKDADFPDLIQKNPLVLVDFWANWCQPCLRFGEVVASLAQQYHKRVVICKVDIDTNGITVKQYKVRTIPTAILFHQGKEIDRMVGYTPMEALQERLDHHLNK